MANTPAENGLKKHAKEYDPAQDGTSNTKPRHAAPLVGQVVTKLRGGTSHMADVARGFQVEDA